MGVPPGVESEEFKGFGANIEYVLVPVLNLC